MQEMPITEIYENVITYYNNLDYMTLLPDDCNEEEYLFVQDEPYRKYKSEDRKEDDLESIRRYLSSYFRYLMCNIFYFNIKRIKRNGTYYISSADAPIFYVILLYSVSHHERHQIIGRWLKGRISDDSYHEIVELCEVLFSIIHMSNAEERVKGRWIEALRIALRTDLANSFVEAELTIRQIFYYSLPFKVDCTEYPAEVPQPICHSDIQHSILNELYYHDANAQHSILFAIISYLNSADTERFVLTESFPPVELLQMKSICEFLYDSTAYDDIIPDRSIIDKYTEYFMSVDKHFQEKLDERKQKDQKRYQRNKRKMQTL